jgi:hypothetical protein
MRLDARLIQTTVSNLSFTQGGAVRFQSHVSLDYLDQPALDVLMSQRLDYQSSWPCQPPRPPLFCTLSATPFLLELLEHTSAMSETVCSAVRVLVP